MLIKYKSFQDTETYKSLYTFSGDLICTIACLPPFVLSWCRIQWKWPAIPIES